MFSYNANISKQTAMCRPNLHQPHESLSPCCYTLITVIHTNKVQGNWFQPRLLSAPAAKTRIEREHW